MLKLASKPKATQSAFTTQEVILNEEKIPDVLDTSDVPETRAAIAEKPKTPTKKNKKRKNQNNNQNCNNLNWSSLRNQDSSNCSRSPQPDCTTNWQKRNPCTGCGGLWHNFSKCYLSLCPDSNLITNEARKKFQNNIKAARFRKRVDNVKKTTENEVDKWRGVDRSSIKKVMYKVWTFSQFDLNARSSLILLDFATSVHVFNIKERFSNFKRAFKGHGLLCSSNIISIEGWGQVSLPLKVKDWIKLPTLNNVAYISNFFLNWFLLAICKNVVLTGPIV